MWLVHFQVTLEYGAGQLWIRQQLGGCRQARPPTKRLAAGQGVLKIAQDPVLFHQFGDGGVRLPDLDQTGNIVGLTQCSVDLNVNITSLQADHLLSLPSRY